MPTVSLIVPVYKTEDKVERCINSILDQTFKDFELILIDDGSPDNCGKICDEYAAKDERIRVFHKENGGVASAKNLGIDNAKGEYLSFVDSDDFIDPDYLETLSDGACNCDLAIAGLKYLSEKTLLPYSSLEFGGSRMIVKKDFTEELPQLLSCRALNYHVAKFYRRKVVESNQIRFTDFKKTGADDTVFNFEVVSKCQKISVIDKCVYNYITYQQSTSRSFVFETFERRLALDHYLIEKTAKMGVLTDKMQEELDHRFVLSAYWSAASFAQNRRLHFWVYKRFFKKISNNERFRTAYKRTSVKITYEKEVVLLFKRAPLRFLLSVRQTGSRIKGWIYRFVPPFVKSFYRKRKEKR